MTYFILVVYKKLAKKWEKVYLKPENITKFRNAVIAYGIIKLTKVFIVLNLWIKDIIYGIYDNIQREIDNDCWGHRFRYKYCF